MKKMALKAVTNTLIVLALFVYALFLLMCMDNENAYRPEFLDANLFTAFYAFSGITLELSQGSWLLLLAALGIVGFFCIAWAISPPIRQLITGSQNRDRKFNALYYTVVFLLFIICFLVFQFLTPLLKQSVVDADAVYAAVIAFVLMLGVESLTAGILQLIFFMGDRLIRYMKAPPPQPPETPQTLSEFLAKARRAPSFQTAFPDLSLIDEYYLAYPQEPLPSEGEPDDLMDLTLGFQAYLSSACSLSLGLDTLRLFWASMAASRLIILDGGPGAETNLLPEFFCRYIGETSFYLPVQPGWKDRTPVLGTYYPPNGSYLETAFLRRLYNASYRQDRLNLMVFQDFNLSRPDRYLGDLVSALELNRENRAIDLLPLSPSGDFPKRFNEDGRLMIPDNTWFFATLSPDQGLVIPEKIYDRGMTVSFSDHNTKLTSGMADQPVHLSAGKLLTLFKNAQKNPACALSDEELRTFLKLCDLVYDQFGIPCGNRFVSQLKKAVPVFVACGGEKGTALDFLFASKILRRVVKKPFAGRTAARNTLVCAIEKSYGKNVFVHSIKFLTDWSAPEEEHD